MDVLKVVFFERLKLLFGREEVDQFADASLEEVEATEDLRRRKVELLGLRHMLESLLSELVLVHISLMQFEARSEHRDQLIMGDLPMVPKDGIIQATGVLLPARLLRHIRRNALLEREDVCLAVDDHLVGDLNEEAGHALVSVVVSGDGVDHLDTVHEHGQGLFDSDWIAIVQRFDETLQRLQVLNIILGFVQVFGDSQLNTAPVRQQQVDTRV